MGLFSRKKGNVTNGHRLSVLNLATDEDYTLFEVRQKFDSDGIALETVVELLKKGQIEIQIQSPDRKRTTLTGDSALEVVNNIDCWKQHVAGESKFLIMATDSGWRWHQKNWKAS